jgi:hypothetical protein
MGTVESIQEIRQRLREDLEQVPRASALSDVLWNMQEACRKFLDGYDLLDGNVVISQETHALVREFRMVFRNELTSLSERYGIQMRKLIPDLEILARRGFDARRATDFMFSTSPQPGEISG